MESKENELQTQVAELTDRQSELIKRFNSLQGLTGDTVRELANVTKDLTKAECLLDAEFLKRVDSLKEQES